MTLSRNIPRPATHKQPTDWLAGKVDRESKSREPGFNSCRGLTLNFPFEGENDTGRMEFLNCSGWPSFVQL